MKLSYSQSKHILFIILGVIIFTFPRYFQVTKITLLFFLYLIGYLEKCSLTKLKSKQFVVYWYLGYLLFALTWSIMAFIKGNPGVNGVFRLEFIWTLVLFVFSVLINIEVRTLVKTMYWSAIVTSLIGLYCIVEPVVGSSPLLEWIPFEPVSNYQGLIRTVLPNIAFMSFLFPFILFQKIPSRHNGRLEAIIAIVLSFLFVLLAGRRVIQLVAVIFVCFFIVLNIKKINLKIIFVTVGLIGVFLLLNSFIKIVDFNLYYEMYIKNLFDNIQQESRYIQLVEFWKFTKEHPIFGVGFGIGIPTHISNREQPWHYEATYSLYLYQTGFVGFTLFVGLFCKLYFRLRSYNNIGKSFAFALLGYLMASATNPYINSGFDYKFPVLMCLLFVSSSFKAKLS